MLVLEFFHVILYNQTSSGHLGIIYFQGSYTYTRRGKPQFIKTTTTTTGGAPGWLSRLSVRLLILAQVMISGS